VGSNGCDTNILHRRPNPRPSLLAASTAPGARRIPSITVLLPDAFRALRGYGAMSTRRGIRATSIAGDSGRQNERLKDHSPFDCTVVDLRPTWWSRCLLCGSASKTRLRLNNRPDLFPHKVQTHRYPEASPTH